MLSFPSALPKLHLKGQEVALPLKKCWGWKPQVDWTLAAAEDPVVVAQEEGWPVGLLRTGKEDARPEREDWENQQQNPAELFSREAFKLCDFYWLW